MYPHLLLHPTFASRVRPNFLPTDSSFKIQIHPRKGSWCLQQLTWFLPPTDSTARDPAQHFLPHLLSHLRLKQGPTSSRDRAGLDFLPIHSCSSFLCLPGKLNSCLGRQQLACPFVAAVSKFRPLFSVLVSLLLSTLLSQLPLPPTLSQEFMLFHSLPAHPAGWWPQGRGQLCHPHTQLQL